MAMTPKVAVAVLLVASLTAGCGAPAEESAEEKEAACWAKRQALLAEISAVDTMDSTTQQLLYSERVKESMGRTRGIQIGYQVTNARIITKMLTKDLPDC